MNINSVKNAYFLGIGGIGMSALARYFVDKGIKVFGYDKVATPITESLEQLGVKIVFEDALDVLPKELKDTGNNMVVYTPAIPASHPQLNYFRESGFVLKKRAEVLGMITRHSTCLAVAGTHGKTSTSAMLGFLLKESGVDCSAFIGGILENYGSNYISGSTEVTVVEADEFDRSFLHLSPDIASLTAMDADHLDIYGSEEGIIQAFNDFKNCLKPGGVFISRQGLPISGMRYGLDGDTHFRAERIRLEEGCYAFDFVAGTEKIEDVKLYMGGRHNIENAVAAMSMAFQYGVSLDKLKTSLAKFKGIQRRFSMVIRRPDFVFIDDYAHHPEELKTTINSARELYPNKEIVGIFQPHLFSRTQDFADGFAESLALLDRLLLLDIYPAREEAIPGVTSEWLLDKVNMRQKQLVSKQELIQVLKADKPQVLLTLGAGDISACVQDIKSAFE